MPNNKWKLDKFETGELVKGARQASIKTAQKVKERAQRRAPVDTGTLRDSARVVETEDGAKVVFDAPYAAAVEKGFLDTETNEDGSKKEIFRMGKGFLGKALNESREDLEEEAGKVLRAQGIKTFSAF